MSEGLEGLNPTTMLTIKPVTPYALVSLGAIELRVGEILSVTNLAVCLAHVVSAKTLAMSPAALAAYDHVTCRAYQATSPVM